MMCPRFFHHRFSLPQFLLRGVPTVLLFAVSHLAAQPFEPSKLGEISSAITDAIEANRLPGAVFLLEREGETVLQIHGRRAVEPESEEMTADTIFDAASLTKVMATAPSVALLIEREEIGLDQPVARHIAEFSGDGKELVTIRQLLNHTSGLRPGLPLSPAWSGYDRAIELACAESLQTEPGTVFRYSDINFILLGEIVRRVSGRPLPEFARSEIYEPLGMADTGFKPAKELLPRIAPTQRTRDGMLRGEVHDPTARAMGGVAGHAGLFTTAADLARYARMLLNRGELDGKRVMAAATVDLMTSVSTPEDFAVRRGLGWDIDSPFSRPRGQWFPIGSFGHTGWTGTCVWIDPHSQTFWLLLSNRVHPDGSGNVLALHRRLGTLAAEAVAGFDFAGVENAPEPLHPVEP